MRSWGASRWAFCLWCCHQQPGHETETLWPDPFAPNPRSKLQNQRETRTSRWEREEGRYIWKDFLLLSICPSAETFPCFSLPLVFSSFIGLLGWLGGFLRNGKGRWAASYWYIRPTKIPNPTKQIWPDFVQRSSPNFSLLELIFWITRQAMQSKKSNQIKKQRWNRLIKYAQIYQTATRGLLYWFLRLGFYIEK